MMPQELSLSDATIWSITLESPITILDEKFTVIFMFIVQASLIVNGTAKFKNVYNSLNTNINSYSETSGGQSSNLYLNVVHFFNASVN
jgi:hypothetical protein